LQDPAITQAVTRKPRCCCAQNWSKALAEMGLNVIDGVANFLLCHLPEDGASAAESWRDAGSKTFSLRDASPWVSNLGHHALRIAVKNAATNLQILRICGTRWTSRMIFLSPNRLPQLREVVFRKAGPQSDDDFPAPRPAPVNQAGVNLQQRRARGDFSRRPACVKNSARHR